MAKVIDYYFSLISPWAYLGSQRLEGIAERHGAEVRAKPVSFATVFPRTGGLPLPKRAPERQAYRLVELQRWRDHLGLPLNLKPSFFPADESLAAKMVIAAGESGGRPLKLAHAILRAVWAEEADIADPATLARLAADTGHDAEALQSKADAAETAAAYDGLSEEAIARGIFGAPSYVFQDEIFWGQDRLDFLDRALSAS